MPSTKAQEYAQSLALFNAKSGPIFSRLYVLKSRTIQNGPLAVQTDRDLLRLRFKIEKKFPDLPDLEKIKGIEKFDAQAEHVLNDLTDYSIELGLVCTHLQNLSAFLKSNFIEKYNFKFDRAIMTSWMEAFLTYIKIMLILETMPEKFELLALFYAAKHIIGEGNPSGKEDVPKASSFRFLVDAFAVDIRQHFLTRFSSNQQTILAIIRELQTVLSVWTDPSKLYEYFDVFNTEVMLQQSQLSLLPHPATFLELNQVHLCCVFVALAVIVCPYLLFDEQIQATLQMVTDQVFIFTIYRDLTFDVHLELEKSFVILDKIDLPINIKDNTSLQNIPKPPKQFKSQSILKSISRQSITNAGINQQKRRHFLIQHIEESIELIKLIPNLITAKFPTLFTLTSWLKEEVLVYYNHFPPFPVRKDTKSYRNINHYQSIDIAQSLQVLTHAIGVMTASHVKVHSFYLQVLVEIDLPAFNQLRLSLSSQEDESSADGALLTSISSVFDLLSSLSTVDSATNKTTSNMVKQLMMSVSDVIHLFSCTESNKTQLVVKQPPIEADILFNLLEHLSHITTTLDPLSLILRLDPFPAAWHRPTWEKTFTIALRQGHGVLTFFGPFESILLNFIQENQESDSSNNVSLRREEVTALGEGAILTFNSMLMSLVTYLKHTFYSIWERFYELETQYLGQEAASRIEKLKREMEPSFGPLPGFESEIWAEGPLLAFAQQQHSLMSILKAIRNKHVIRVFTQEVDLIQFVLIELKQAFHTKCSIILFNKENKALRRFSDIMLYFDVGMKFLQEMCAVLDVNVDDEMLVEWKQREIFGMVVNAEKIEENEEEEEQQQEYLHPHSPLPLFINTQEGTIIHTLSEWFLDLINIIANPANLLVYSPSEKSFISLRNVINMPVHNASHMIDEYHYTIPSNYTNIDSESKVDLMIELYLSPPELHSLVKLIGVYGTRILQANIFGVLVDRLDDIIAFIQVNKAYLRILERDYCFSIISAQNLKVDVFAHHLKIVGICFALLELLSQAVGDVAGNTIIPELHDFLQQAFDSIHLQHPQHKLHEKNVDFIHLAQTLGVENSLQISLFLSLLKSRTAWQEDDIEALQLLPVVMSAVFGNAVWDQIQYYLPFEVFMGNEHCTQLALARLFPMINALSHVVHSTANDSGIGPAKQGTSVIHQNEKWHQQEIQLYKQYLAIASQCLLSRRNTLEWSKSNNHRSGPFPALFQQIKLFVQLSSPVITMAQLEECLPHDFVQFGMVDMTMGKFTAADRYLPLRKLVVQDNDENTRLMMTDDLDG